MVFLKDLIDKLVNLELSDLSEGKPEWSDGPVSYSSIIHAIGLGLTDLHKRYNLFTRECLVELKEGKTTYELHPRYARSNDESEIPIEDRYINDISGARPFTGDIIKIQAVFDHCRERPINDCLFDESVYLISPTTLQVVSAPADVISVIYQADHRALPTCEEDLEGYELDIPSTYSEPLILFAASKIYGGRGAVNELNNAAIRYMKLYEEACLRIEILGLDNRYNNSNNLFNVKGYV